MTEEDRKFFEEQFHKIHLRIDDVDDRVIGLERKVEELHREMDGRVKALWREMNNKFREQKAMLRVQDNKLDAMLDLLAEQENVIVEREAA